MPSRNQSMIRRDINRLNETIERHKDSIPALAAISSLAASSAERVNDTWRKYQENAVKGDMERDERDINVGQLIKWIQSWRPVIMLTIPGADANIKNIPTGGATPDDVVRVVEDMVSFVKANPEADSFRDQMIGDLGNKLEETKKDIKDATASLPAEASARHEFTNACLDANPVLIRGLEIVRATFGRTSPEYKQFIANSQPENPEEDEIPEGTPAGV